MPYAFGGFTLDEEARSLKLRGTPVAMQPLVFDLLAYLVRNGGRVVPKDELMDVLWPGVTVTEASLQRLVSLARRALDAGGLGSAIRSFVRHGYRFAIDEASLGLLAPAEGVTEEGRALAHALSRKRDWVAAVRAFESLDAERRLDSDDIDLWALAVECRGRPVEAIPVLSRAVSIHLADNRPERAARSAVTLAKLELERGAPAVAAGWLERAEALLSGVDAPAELAYHLWMKSRLATFGGRTEMALIMVTAAHEAALRSGDAGLIALTLTYQGFYNLTLGRAEEGVNQQNHAAAIALSSQVDPVTGSLVYCNILWSCRTFSDWSRARQWSDGFDSWCEASFAEHPGSCDLHRAEILGSQRALGAALAAIDAAIPKLSEEEAWSIGDGYRVRGDIRAMIGDLDAARADYAAAYATGWDAEPGNAMLLADEGKVDAALAALDRTLEGTSWFHLQRRGVLLAHKARIAALGGRRDLAEATIAELESRPELWKQPAVRALVTEARAHMRVAGDHEATRLLLLARQLWTGAGIEYHAARVRLDLAGVSLAAGDEAGARTEISAAEHTAARIGSRRLAEAAAALAANAAGARGRAAG